MGQTAECWKQLTDFEPLRFQESNSPFHSLMNNVFIKGQIPDLNLDRKLNLHNGSLIIVKQRDTITGIYMVVSFRDNKNKYNGSNTTSYCSLVNLDNGSLAFEERCSRSTTVRRVLNHVLRLGFSMPYNPNSKENDNQMKDYDIDYYGNGAYKLEVDLR